jgi:hypothetical protein
LDEDTIMKYICLGYMDETLWGTMSDRERNSFMDACFAYDDELRSNGHFVGGEALQESGSATMIRQRNGRVAITDGPFAETKEQLGGILVLEARDLNHAIQLMSDHPSVRMGGSWEVRPAADLTHMIEESKQRRTAAR